MLKVTQAAFAETCFRVLSDVHKYWGGLQMAPSSVKGSVTPWNIIEAISEIWNVKYEIWNFIRIFLLTISVHLLYIYMYGFSVYLSSLTILSLSLYWWTFKVEKIIGVLNEQDFYEIHHEIWNIEIWNLYEI